MTAERDLTRPTVIKDLLNQHGIRPRHRWGQNFLIDGSVVSRIIAAVGATTHDLVLEIGPGVGTLTCALARAAGRVLAVEIDPGLVDVLAQTTAGCGNVRVVHGDALTIDWPALVAGEIPPGGKLLLAANLPYYITTPLLMRFLEGPLPVQRLVVMVQKEVAERIVAAPGGKDYGMLSVAVQYHAAPNVVIRVGRGAFWPAPTVDSTVLVLERRTTSPVAAPPEALFPVVRAAFGQRRKTLGNAVAAGLGLPRPHVEAACAAAGIDSRRRAETLALVEFSHLALALDQRRAPAEG